MNAPKCKMNYNFIEQFLTTYFFIINHFEAS